MLVTSYAFERKHDGKNYEYVTGSENPEKATREFATDLFHAKILNCRGYKIVRKNHYNGTQTVIVYYGNGSRSRYTLHTN